MSDMRKFMNLMEDGDAIPRERPSNPEITYQDEETKVIAYLQSYDSQSYTKLAQKIERIKEIKDEMARLEKEVKALGREKVGDLFAAGDAVKTRVVDTCSFILTLNKDSAPTTTVKYAEVIKELTTSLTPELITVLETLKTKYSSVTQKASALSIEKKATESLNEGLWDSIAAFGAKLLAQVKVWGAKYDNKLNSLKSKLAIGESLDALNDPAANSVWESVQEKSPWMKFAESKKDDKNECIECGSKLYGDDHHTCDSCQEKKDLEKEKSLEESLGEAYESEMNEYGSSPYDKVGKDFQTKKPTPYDQGVSQNQGAQKDMDEPALISTWQTHEGTKVYVWRSVQGGREVISMVNSAGKKLPWHREPKNYSDAAAMLKGDYEYQQVANQKELSLEAEDMEADDISTDEIMGDDTQGLTEYNDPRYDAPDIKKYSDTALESMLDKYLVVAQHSSDSHPEGQDLKKLANALAQEAHRRGVHHNALRHYPVQDQDLNEYSEPDDMYPVVDTLDDDELRNYLAQWRQFGKNADMNSEEGAALIAFGNSVEAEAAARGLM